LRAQVGAPVPRERVLTCQQADPEYQAMQRATEASYERALAAKGFSAIALEPRWLGGMMGYETANGVDEELGQAVAPWQQFTFTLDSQPRQAVAAETYQEHWAGRSTVHFARDVHGGVWRVERAPSVHRYFNYDGVQGLTEFLTSNSSGNVKSLVRDTHVNGLRFIPAGKPTRFASELLAKEKMRRLIEDVHSEFPGYMVIIDSPPVLATPDPLVLSRLVDGVIMVIRARKTPKDYLAKALSAFSANKILGVVLNGADLGLGSKYYYYYSSNGHG